MQIVFIQHGDFRHASNLIETSGQETYHAQRHSMRIVDELAHQGADVTVICLAPQVDYELTVKNGIRTIGRALYRDGQKNVQPVLDAIETQNPSHIILRTPDRDILAFCLSLGAQILPVFADTLTPRLGLRGILDRIRFRRLIALMANPQVRYIGNHNLTAAQSLVRFGAAKERVIPWDWPRPDQPTNYPARPAPPGRTFKALYIGNFTEQKGIFDLIDAFGEPGMEDIRLSLVGKGDTKRVQNHIEALGRSQHIDLIGQVPFDAVLPEILAHDALVVPSRQSYQEGLPGVIYQGLAGRIPLILSPHPVFQSYFQQGRDAFFTDGFKDSDYARALRTLRSDPSTYEKLSEQTALVFERLHLKTDWCDLIEHWLSGSSDSATWLHSKTLKNFGNQHVPDIRLP